MGNPRKPRVFLSESFPRMRSIWAQAGLVVGRVGWWERRSNSSHPGTILDRWHQALIQSPNTCWNQRSFYTFFREFSIPWTWYLWSSWPLTYDNLNLTFVIIWFKDLWSAGSDIDIATIFSNYLWSIAPDIYDRMSLINEIIVTQNS